MTRKDVTWQIVYYLIVLFVWWLTSREGPPLRVAFWYHTYRVSQKMARMAGRAGLVAEHNYYQELERTRA